MKKIIGIIICFFMCVYISNAQVEIISGGTATAYTLTVPGSFSLRNGIQITFKANVVCGASPTINVNSIGAVLIKKDGGASDLVANDIGAGQVVELVYDGTFWQMLSPSGNPSGNLSGTGTVNYVPKWSSTSALSSSIIYDTGTRIGIGTASPGYKLDVAGDGQFTGGIISGGQIYIGNSGNYQSFAVSENGGLGAGINLQATGAGGRSYTIYSANGSGLLQIDDETAGLTRLAINSSGNLGIGTTSPTSRFSVGAASQFQVNSTGDIVKINNITTSFPSSQGGPSTVLTNNGSGVLSWTTPAAAPVQTASNGLTLSASDVKLGGTLTANTTITQVAFTLNETYTGTATTGQVYNANSVTTASAKQITANGLTTGNVLDLQSTSITGNASKILNVTRSGANSTATKTNYGVYVSAANSGATSTNIAGYFNAINATNNYALIVPSGGGKVGIGTATPTAQIDVIGNNSSSSDFYIGSFSGAQSTASTFSITGVNSTPYFSASSGNTLSYIYGGYFGPNNANNGTITNIYGTYNNPYNNSTGTINSAFGTYSRVDNYAGGVISNLFGVYVAAPSNTGTITNKFALITEANAGNVGIGTSTPVSLLSAGATSQFQVNTTGDIVKINNVATSFPVVQGAANSVLTNNGSGTLTWVAPGGAGSTNWAVTGNSGTVDGTNFIGTTDNVPFNIRVNNQKAGRIEVASGTANSFFGYQAGNSNTGTYNTALGYQTLMANTSGQSNTAVGYLALNSNNGSYNTAMGVNALLMNSSGTQNVAYGMNAMNANTTGGFNTAFGTQALQNNVTANYNVAVGSNAMQGNTYGLQNTAVGADALKTQNFANGAATYSSENVAIGYRALYLNQPTASSNGWQNTAVGSQTMLNNTVGERNTAIGTGALYGNTIGGYNLASGTFALYSSTTATNNTASGAYALFNNTTGSYNTVAGYNAGVTSVLANANTTGNFNTFIGYNSGPSTSSQLTNATAIGNSAVVGASNSLVLGGIGANTVNVGINTTTPAQKLDVADGNIILSNSANAAGELRLAEPSGSGTNYTAFKAQGQASDITYTLPNANGSGYLSNDGSGGLTWSAAGTLSGGTTNYVPKWSSGNSLSATSLLFDNGTTVGVNNAAPSASSKLDVVGSGNGSTVLVTDNSLTNGALLYLQSNATTGTAASSSRMIAIARSGANGGATHTAYGLRSDITNTGPTSTNIAGYFNSSGATNNYAIVVPSGGGNVGIGTSTPSSALLQIVNASALDAQYINNSGMGSALYLTNSNTANTNEAVYIDGAANSSNIHTWANGTGANNMALSAYASNARTISTTLATIDHASTSSTASITRTGLSVTSTGTWNGAGAISRGLYVNSTGGTSNYAIIVPSGGGSVGIGTSAPVTQLHVHGVNDANMSLSTQGAAAADDIAFNIMTQNNAAGSLSLGGAGTKGWLFGARGNAWTTAGEQNDFFISGYDGTTWNQIFNIDMVSKNIGIGTISPSYPLHVVKSEALASNQFGIYSDYTATNGNTKVAVYGTSTVSGGSGATAVGVMGNGASSPVGQVGVIATLGLASGAIPTMPTNYSRTAFFADNNGSNAAGYFKGPVILSSGIAGYANINVELSVDEGHIQSRQATLPTSGFTAGITGVTVVAGSTDTKGSMTTTGTITATGGVGTITITFNMPYNATTPTVVVSPANAAARSLAYYITTTTTAFTINLINNTGAGVSAPSYNYIVLQ